jgi:hypothetical protein
VAADFPSRYGDSRDTVASPGTLARTAYFAGPSGGDDRKRLPAVINTNSERLLIYEVPMRNRSKQDGDSSCVRDQLWPRLAIDAPNQQLLLSSHDSERIPHRI